MDPIQMLLSLGHQSLQAGDLNAAQRHGADLLHYDLSANADAHFFLGTVSLARGDVIDAVLRLEQARKLRPRHLGTLGNLGGAYARQGNWAAAEACFREAVRIKPDFAGGLAGLGASLVELGRVADAVPVLREDARLRPASADAFANLAGALMEQGSLTESLACSETAVRLNPNHAGAHLHRARAWFLLGDYAKAWPEYEWRWRGSVPLPRIEQPQWDGSPLNGRTILLWGEQGLGDVVQFIRFAPLVKARGGTVILACDPRLTALMATCPGIDRVVPLNALPAFDVWLPLMSAPRIFDTVPAQIPYLNADPARVERWRPTIESIPGFRVGVAWRGKASYRSDRKRSFALASLAPLAAVPGVTLINLQVGLSPKEVAASGVSLVELPGLDADAAFVDTAAVMKHLDLVVCCDTAVGHLAGALGVPVWEAHSFVPDWRWVMGRETSPWYPTLKIYAQPSIGNWPPVFERMAAGLRALAHSPTRRV